MYDTDLIALSKCYVKIDVDKQISISLQSTIQQSIKLLINAYKDRVEAQI